MLAASGQIPPERLATLEVLGELSLSGEVRAIKGALPAALKATQADRALLLPQANVAEAALAQGAVLHSALHLAELAVALHSGPLPAATATAAAPLPSAALPDLADVRGQLQAKRALEVAAAGGHSLLMLGPPGSGKSMLAQRLQGLLPPLTDAEALEVATVASISHAGFDPARWGIPPFRAPHHTASGVALVGGGSGF